MCAPRVSYCHPRGKHRIRPRPLSSMQQLYMHKMQARAQPRRVSHRQEREEMLSVAKEKGWQGCFQPNRCLCKAEFCYVCGTPWRICDCALNQDAAGGDFFDHGDQWPAAQPDPAHRYRQELLEAIRRHVQYIFRAERAVERL